ncbi:Intracellular serine protease [Actinomadura rubteroloni]|uniref:Intracellular serine protease n=1 Tax=Actinomadura rubteroloni TaxID=1926885 RepID=A0A2P4UP26_9ACTN|nr:S8 family serine peptidase [Actinomadura rubteroloni]POM26810.1 Intracellular serine protease [Actinomadura rubteroloni]
MRWTAIAVLAGCVAPLAAAPAAQAAPRAPANCSPEQGAYGKAQLQQEPAPWWLETLNVKAAHDKATGKGVTVAVVDSGVSGANPQLAGQLLPTVDVSKSGQADCVGHGTEVAALIAAKRGVTPFYGVAPDAKILPVKFAAQSSGVDSGLAAKGIEEAIAKHADVINISTQSISDDPRLRAAVKHALARNIPVVAAAGNLDREKGDVPELMYPGGYPGVITVGAVDRTGSITTFSNPKTPVTVIAPGKDIITASADGRYIAKDGTSFAAPIVAGVVALIRQAYPDLTPVQIKNRLERTADGGKGAGSGAGMVNPYEAVTAVLSGGGPSGAPAAGALAPVEMVPAKRVDPRQRNIAFGVAGGGIGLAAVVAAVGAVLPLGRRRGWRPGRVVVAEEPHTPRYR